MSDANILARKIWDLPTRIGHWSLVILVAFSWWSAENHQMDWHRYSGYAVLSILLFRILWGFFGSSTARFGNFLRGPRAFFAYARTLLNRSSTPSIGHNPMGGWAVMALLLLLSAQVALGLFAEDTDGLESGPLSYLVSYDTARWAAETHEALFNVLFAFIVLHIAAVFFYRFYKHDNVIGPMITGRKLLSADQAATVVMAPWWHVVLTLAVVVGFVWWLVS